jgi:hypothetical protein
MLHRAAASGLLAQNPVNLRETHDLVKLRHTLTHLVAETYKEYYHNEFLASLTVQICMAVANRGQYTEVQEKTFSLLDRLREEVLPTTEFNSQDD